MRVKALLIVSILVVLVTILFFYGAGEGEVEQTKRFNDLALKEDAKINNAITEGIRPRKYLDLPLEVRLKIKRPVKLKEDNFIREDNKLSDILDINLRNVSQEPIEVIANSGVWIEVEGYGRKLRLDKKADRRPNIITIKPGGSALLLGGENGLDGAWVHPINDTVKVRAIYRTSILGSYAFFKSDWVVVQSEKKRQNK